MRATDDPTSLPDVGDKRASSSRESKASVEPVDSDWAAEQREWLEALEAVLEVHGTDRARALLQALEKRAAVAGVPVPDTALNSPYRNTIPVRDQPHYPGNIDLEERIENLIRWNALAMVLAANDGGSGVGGHIATYASTATLFEVGFHHFFRAPSESYGGDLVIFQAHASPGVYARAFLEGRLSREQLENFRRELQPEGGLPSYPHPRRLPEFWQAPSASMGLSTVSAIYQARFARYLENRGLKPRNGGKVWCFIGDGEADEPEVLGTAAIAAREKLDNLILVVNCNLQRLDGPVRGNSKIIQELERSFRGVGWNVIKVIWGGEWDALLERDTQGVLQARMEEAVDGDYQMYSVLPGHEVREHWVGDNEELAEIMKTLSDESVRTIKRGGHDHQKIYAAYERAAFHANGRPTVVLAKTIKGYGLGMGSEGSNRAHQKKNMSDEERLECARRFGVRLSREQVEDAELYQPPEDSPELRYLRDRRETLGGVLPRRSVECPSLPVPPRELFRDLFEGTGERSISTTLAMVRILAKLLRDEEIGRYVVPIVPDEARTFGMDGLFPTAGIYSPQGQLYRPVDAGTILPYRESRDGQILQEGICEAGAIASFLAAGSAYAQHGIPTIPFYIFYSMFGFQRVGDMIWAAADQMCRGFLLGGTSGRTTLNGEGLQHQDGHSHVTAATLPTLLSYDPAFAFELAVIVRDGLRRMYAEQEDVFYYVTLTNENYAMPPMPDGPGERIAADLENSGERTSLDAMITRGLYRFREASEIDEALPKSAPRVQLLGSGAILYEVLHAQQALVEAGIAADVWSVTSWTELHREAAAVERRNRLAPDRAPETPWLTRILRAGLGQERGCFVAASDYMRLLPDAIARWVPGPLVSLGTDGFGLSESRDDLRDHFEVSRRDIERAALAVLARNGEIEPSRAAALERRSPG